MVSVYRCDIRSVQQERVAPRRSKSSKRQDKRAHGRASINDAWGVRPKAVPGGPERHGVLNERGGNRRRGTRRRGAAAAIDAGGDAERAAGRRAQHAGGGAGGSVRTSADTSARRGADSGARRSRHRRRTGCDGGKPRRCPQPARASEAEVAKSAARSAGARRTLRMSGTVSGPSARHVRLSGKRSAQRAEATGVAAEIGAKRRLERKARPRSGSRGPSSPA